MEEISGRIRELIERLENLLIEAKTIEKELHNLNYGEYAIIEQEIYDQIVERLLYEEREKRISSAFARIDFRDDHYKFIRAIDGDTIVVDPPSELKEWMKDVHIRLYGLETPEKWEEEGNQYRDHLQSLCSDSLNGDLMILWERERLNTNYKGFPRSSFERGVGHVFIRVSNNEYYYINGLMHILQSSSLERKGNSILRSKNKIINETLNIPWLWPCKTIMKEPQKTCSRTFNMIRTLRPPVCLLSYPRLPSLDPRDPSFAERVVNTLMTQSRDCPFKEDLRARWKHYLPIIHTQKVSPFDIPLVYLRMWANERYMKIPQ